MARRHDEDDDDADGGFSDRPRRRPVSRRHDDEEEDDDRSSRRRRDDDDDDDDYEDRPRRRRAGASSRVMAPSLSLMIIGLLSFVLLVLYWPCNLYFLLNDPDHQALNRKEKTEEIAGALIIVPLMALSSLGVVIGALCMKTLKSYEAAMAAAILAVIPCLSPFCLLGIPFGIWALMTLNDPVVRRAFRRS